MQINVTQSPPTVLRTADLATDGARFILERAQSALSARGLFRLGLAGGKTPRSVYVELAKIGKDLPWTRVQITFGDERCVPPEDADSNFAMARESLLDHVPIPEGNVFRIRGEIAPEDAARECEAQLSAVAGRMGEVRYRHDLLLLGLGEDGHTASLFPGSPALEETTRNVIPTIGPKPPPQRVTFTLPLINASRHVCFITKTTGKEDVLEAVLSGDQRYPAARVHPVDGSITWLIGV
jgi:6-phosphogluconolactonase